MDDGNRPRVAVIGAGHRGRGWAALALSRGWAVSLYDPESALLQRAAPAVSERVRRLTDFGRADPLAAAGARALLVVGRSLLHSVGEADLVFDALPADLAGRQRLLEQIEQVARPDAILVSLTGSMHASALSARLRRPERHLVAFALDPVEMVPLVEIVPGPHTALGVTEQVKEWFTRLNRQPVVLQREVTGNASGRILAAVWRECIDLVLEGVVELGDVDLLVSRGPAAALAAAGPNLLQVMGAGAQGTEYFIGEALQAHETLWGQLASWETLSGEDRHRLIRLIERTYRTAPGELRAERDKFLARLLGAMEERPSGLFDLPDLTDLPDELDEPAAEPPQRE
ncbi:MAG TPA: 3-hydroxyacyl-CoA dehydrogenase NAD-binding domain-containing protein [Gemmatimonadales bacterium]|nr:3-hydroxyacyl-CoA dehydrogenase NAD-binding domain-containing protein [Gemmatimonadales bacterium]